MICMSYQYFSFHSQDFIRHIKGALNWDMNSPNCPSDLHFLRQISVCNFQKSFLIAESRLRKKHQGFIHCLPDCIGLQSAFRKK